MAIYDHVLTGKENVKSAPVKFVNQNPQNWMIIEG